MEYIRVWKEIDIEEVKNHIIMVEDKYGHCPGMQTDRNRTERTEKMPRLRKSF